MKLFSTRYKNSYYLELISKAGGKNDTSKFLDNRLRNRIVSLIKDTVSLHELEPFILKQDVDTEEYFLNIDELDNLSNREIGYSLSYFITSECEIITRESYDDRFLLDIIELFIIFSTNRNQLIARLGNIFIEEGAPLAVIKGFVELAQQYSNTPSVLQIKNPVIREKYKILLNLSQTDDGFEEQARLSADIIQYIFSSPISQGETKDYSEELCSKIAKLLSSKDHEELSKLINDYIKLIKKMNNSVYNIRHTDKSTIKLESNIFYKVIASSGKSIIEMVFSLLREDLIEEVSIDSLKETYMKTNQVRNKVTKFHQEEDGGIPF